MCFKEAASPEVVDKLVAEGNLFSDKIKEKVQLIEDRYCLPQGLGSRSQVG